MGRGSHRQPIVTGMARSLNPPSEGMHLLPWQANHRSEFWRCYHPIQHAQICSQRGQKDDGVSLIRLEEATTGLMRVARHAGTAQAKRPRDCDDPEDRHSRSTHP